MWGPIVLITYVKRELLLNLYIVSNRWCLSRRRGTEWLSGFHKYHSKRMTGKHFRGKSCLKQSTFSAVQAAILCLSGATWVWPSLATSI